MERLIERDLAALKDMTPSQLRAKYAELHGEPSRSGNKQWLIRRCAWRIQALAEAAEPDWRKQRRMWKCLLITQEVNPDFLEHLQREAMEQPELPREF